MSSTSDQWFEDQFKEIYLALVRFMNVKTADLHRAEDFAQEAFLRVEEPANLRP